MPYIVLGFGALLALFAFYRFFVKASPRQIKKFFRIVVLLVYVGILLFFAVTGRVIVSLGLLVLCVPFVISYFKNKRAAPPKLPAPEKKDEDKNKDEED